MRFSVIIATLGRPDVLTRTLDSVAACDPAPDELIVVDGDPERSSEPATASSRPFPVGYMTAPKGLPKQRNAGIDKALGDVLVFIDDDVSIPKDTFAVLESIYSEGSIVGATALIVEPTTQRIGKKHSPMRRLLPGGGPEGTFTRYGYPRRLVDLETERDISFMHGSFMSVRAEVGRRVRFDEILPGYALAEDEDFSYRVSQEGRIRFVPSLEVIHAKEGHGSRDARAFGRTVVINRSYLFHKNFKRTVAARMQFAMLIALFIGHRLVNREFAEARGLLEGSVKALNNPLVRAAKRKKETTLRVAFVSSHARAGGSEKYLVELLSHLDRESVGPVLCLEDGPLMGELRASGHDARVVQATGSLPSIARAARRIRASLREEHPTVIHANGVKAALACVLAPGKVPVVWVKHDFSYDGPLVRFVARRCDAVVGVSAACLNALTTKQRHGAMVVHTGVHVPDIDRAAARRKLVAELGIDETDRIIGLVGRLHPVKGHLELIAAAKQMVQDDPELQFVFIGGDDPAVPDHAAKVRRAAAALQNRAHFLGHRDEVLELMAGLDVGVLPSHRDGAGTVEALPLTALEMMGAGTPVVAYASGGIPEALGSCGVLVSTGDVAGLATALALVVSDSRELDRMTECGRARVREDFSVEQMVEAMRRIYSEQGAS
jgi:glycosyltransferase involved in cell wall biosynthesis